MTEVDSAREKNLVQVLMDANPMRSGATWYPVSFKWWKQWKEYVGMDDAENTGPRPLEIDNTDLQDEDDPMQLKMGLQEHYHYVTVHGYVWNKLVGWYGGGPAFPRTVITRGSSVLTQVIELYPKTVHVYKMATDGSPDVDSKISILVGMQETFQDLVERYRKESPESEFRLWIEKSDGEGEPSWECLLSDAMKQSMESSELEGPISVLLESKEEDGDWVREYVERDFRDFRAGDVIDALDTVKKWYESVVKDMNETQILVHYKNWPAKWDAWIDKDSDKLAPRGTHTNGPYKARSTSPEAGGYSTFLAGNDEGTPIQEGIVGLRNLGNTCFMNCILQCLSATDGWREYWLSDQFINEINTDNPLGWQGKVALEYGKLIKEIWSGKFRVIIPRSFKQTIGEFAPRFSGYSQQDSAELLSFLLDGIHEDLNRVQKKPLTQPVEGNGRPDEVVAQEAWDTHRLRHDSIVVDQFQGQLKSRLSCPQCNHVSVTFDPYMYLSVPLPSIKEKTIEVVVCYADPKRPSRVFGVNVPKLGTIMDLKVALADAVHVPLQRLVVGEIWKERVYKFFANNYLLGDVRSSDDIWAWEVPEMDEMEPQKEVEVNRPYSFSQLMMIDVEEEEQSWMRGKRLSIEPYGVPAPLLLDAHGKMPASEIRSRIERVLATYTNESMEATYTIRILDFNGRSVKQDLPDGDTLVDVTRVNFGVDWGECREAYNLDKVKEFEVDDSAPRRRNVSAASPQKKASLDLSQCLDCYVEEETLEEENAWYCSNCKEFVCAKKKFDLWNAPKVLVIHLKRFQFSRLYRDKIDSFVDFPIEGLDLSAYVLHNNAPPVYDLYGVSNHMGGLGGGHYTAYVRNHLNGQWYDISDSCTSTATEDDVKSSAAYVLFYKRRT